MDYKYIEQLLERYWRCETTLQEEEILRSFFSQEDVPVVLLAYRDLFVAQREETKQEVLDESFDERMLAMVDEQKPVKPIVITMRQRLMPLFKAAAVVAIILTLGNAAQIAFEPSDGTISRGGEPCCSLPRLTSSGRWCRPMVRRLSGRRCPA